ncbi:MAG: sugar phosphate isomerase/epimerase [Clostridia bacterium]|nr:sugar phosphate isomerase/epimerase [Clostridia bacterium]
MELCDSFESENIGICWDFGHAHLASVDQLRGLQTVGKRLVCTHIHDNFGNGDDHLISVRGQ